MSASSIKSWNCPDHSTVSNDSSERLRQHSLHTPKVKLKMFFFQMLALSLTWLMWCDEWLFRRDKGFSFIHISKYECISWWTLIFEQLHFLSSCFSMFHVDNQTNINLTKPSSNYLPFWPFVSPVSAPNNPAGTQSLFISWVDNDSSFIVIHIQSHWHPQ